MAEFVLGAWITTAIAGAYMWSFTTGAHRPESNARASGLPASLLFIHPALALSGLGFWIAYVVRDVTALAWVAIAAAGLAALIGDVLLMRTVRGRRERAAQRAARKQRRKELVAAGKDGPDGRDLPPLDTPDERLQEEQIPELAIAVHGVLAVLTLGGALIEAVMVTF